MKRRSTTRPRRRRRRKALRSTALLGVVLATLFMACWGANRVETLERQRTRLEQELQYQNDEYYRLLAAWLQATERERIVGRARVELSLVEPAASEQEIVVLHRVGEDSPEHPVVDYLARAFGRFGEIRDAAAKEQR